MLNKKFIRSISFLLAAVVSLTACSGKDTKKENGTAGKEEKQIANFNKSGLPIVNDPITLKMVVVKSALHGSFKDMSAIKMIEEKTNIKLDITEISDQTWLDQKGILFASKDLPDVFMGCDFTSTDLDRYGKSGQLEPLNDLIESYAPNVKSLFSVKPAAKAASTLYDGKIYSLPFYDEFLAENIPDNLFINKKWLQKLNLPVPTTTEEFAAVLKAFKEKDPNGNGKADEIPFTFRASAQINPGDFSLSGSFGVVDNPNNHLMFDNDKLVFVPTDARYKESIKWFRQLYKDKLIDPEIFIQDQKTYIAKGKSQPDPIVGAFILYADENFLGADRAYADYQYLLPLKGPKGDQLWNRYDNSMYIGKYSITTSCKYKEAAMRLGDYIFDPTVSTIVHWGEENKNLQLGSDGSVKILPPPANESVDSYRFKLCPAPAAPGVILKEQYDKFTFFTDKQKKIERYKAYDPYAIKKLLPKVLPFNSSENDQIVTLFKDIDNYVKQKKSDWITGTGDIDKEWDSYVKTLKDMGLDNFVKIYSDANARSEGKK